MVGSMQFDLSNWSGQTITLGFDYITDGGLAMEGLHIDNIEIIADGVATLIDDGEAESEFCTQWLSIK